MIDNKLYRKNFYLQVQKSISFTKISPQLWAESFQLFQNGLKEEMPDIISLDLLIDFAITLINAKVMTELNGLADEIRIQKEKLLKFVTAINSNEYSFNTKEDIISLYNSIMNENEKSKRLK